MKATQAASTDRTSTALTGTSTAPAHKPSTTCSGDDDICDCTSLVEEPTAIPTGGQDDKCIAHGDHWHCPDNVKEPPYPPSEEPCDDEKEDKDGSDDDNNGCTAHGDHWHCPEGVEEPSHVPGQKPDGSKSGDHDADDNGCIAHDDHWDCPEGVKEPPYPPSEKPPKGDEKQQGIPAKSTLATVHHPVPTDDSPIVVTAGASRFLSSTVAAWASIGFALMLL